ncbi:MAG: amidohydrolase [Pedosphaera sp.]|nr:amidohydrolase [Pedosphaera sp.]
MSLSAPITRRLFVILTFCWMFLLGSLLVAAPTELLPPGFRPVPPGVHALVGGTVVIKPGQVISNATIIVRDGFIQTVAADAAVPADARVWDMSGLTIYPGFIDAYLSLGAKGGDKSKKSEPAVDLTAGGVKFYGLNQQASDAGSLAGPVYEVAMVSPERRAAQTYTPDPKALEGLREIGFTAGNVVPEKGIVRGTSVFVALSDTDANRAIIKPDVFQHIAYDLEHRRTDVYPESLMGAIAVVRQTFFDAQHYALDQADFLKKPAGRVRPAYNLGMEALAPVLGKKMRVVFDPQDALMVDRSTRIAHELDLDFYMVSSGQEWRRPEFAKAAGVPFIVPLNFPTLPKMPQEDDWEQVSLDQLRAWDWAPENAAVLQNQGLEIALTTYGLDDKKDFRKNLRLAVDRGLSESNALAALTTVPARLCGLDSVLGTIEAGKQANLTIVDGKGYFDPEAKVRSVWIDGRFYRIPTEEEKEKKETAAKTDDDGKEASAKPESSEEGDPNKTKAKTEKPEKPEKPGQAATEEKSKADKKQADKETKLAKSKELQKRVARSPLEGRGVLTNAPTVLIRNATIWTCGPQGILTNADLLIVDGKVNKVGTVSGDFQNSQTLTIDGTGLHVTPGLIDCHSHSAILGEVNESTLPSSAMVRIGDVVNSESENLYEELAGGLTMAHLLHGSANPIGGQNCLIKLRDGEPAEGLKFEGALGSIKFALGENVKQSNWGDKFVTRFPQTRMGVRTFYANRFTAARQYLKEWDEYKKSGGLPPRRDLELEALGEILQGTRLIHCHSYRQDEILMLIRLMEDFNVKIGTFQHVLEGYKVADEIAKHGAGASTFSDWWAYKFEVYDAIPYNGTLMHDRGVVVSFNSDSSDLARRMYLEAAKAVKFGGASESEALKFVTLNPAKQLRVDLRVGSLEPGKDADFVIWSKAPLDSFTVCLQTWIDGKKYFDAALAPARAAALTKERADLIAKAKKISARSDSDGSDDKSSGNDLFFQRSLEHMYDGIVRHCTEDEDE